MKISEKILFSLLAIFPFAMGAVYALVNMTGGWARFSLHRGYAFYGVLPDGFSFWIGLMGASLAFSLAWFLSVRFGAECGTRREMVKEMLWIFLTAFLLRIGFCFVFARGVGNSWDPLWCWERACGFPVSDNRHVLFPAWMNFALYIKGFVSLFGNHYGLFQLAQTAWGGLGAVAVFLLGYEVTRNRGIAAFAGLLYAFSPSAVVYLSAGAFPEHQATPLFCLSAWLLVRCMMREMPMRAILTYSIVAGICLGVGDAIKPFFPVFLPAIVITALFAVVSCTREYRSRVARKAGVILVGVALARCIVCSSITSVSERVFECPLDNADAVPHYVAVGLDRRGEGMIHLGRHSRSYMNSRMAGEPRETAMEKSYETLRNDWSGHWREIPEFLFKKSVWAWQEDVPAFHYYRWNLRHGYAVPEYAKRTCRSICRYGASSALFYYFFLMVLACVFSVRMAVSKSARLRLPNLLPGLLIMGFFALMLVSESQGRYKCLVMPYITLFAACAFCRKAGMKEHDACHDEADDRLCIVMPVYNEAEAIGPVLEKWARSLDALGVDYVIRPYNDGSKDDSLSVMRRKAGELNADGRIRIEVRDKPNGGHGNTVLTGYREASREGFGWIFQVDSDDEMGPEKFAELWSRRGDYDFLAGIRDGRVQQMPRKIISFVSRLCVRLFYGKSVWDVNVPYRLMRVDRFRGFYETVPLTTFAPNVVLSGLAARHSLRCFETRVQQRDRTTGEVSIRKWKLFKAAVLSFAQTVMCSFGEEDVRKG